MPQASGGDPPYNYWMTGLPSGLSFNRTSHVIEGTPGAVGESTVTIGVIDSEEGQGTSAGEGAAQEGEGSDEEEEGVTGQQEVSRSFKITISAHPALQLAAVSNLTGTVGVAFTATMPQASEGCPSYDYEMSTAPPGLSFSVSTFKITGTPTTAGTYPMTYKVTDSLSASVSRSFTITIVEPTPPPPPKPAKPTGLRANGHYTEDSYEGGHITLRWGAVRRATSYDVRYAREICAVICLHRPWTEKTSISTTESSGTVEAKLMLNNKTLYRVQVRAVSSVGASSWSDWVGVFPTNTPEALRASVATIPVRMFQKDGLYSYYICNPQAGGLSRGATRSNGPVPIPSTINLSELKNGIASWSTTVKWRKSDGNNILRVRFDGTITSCDPIRSYVRDQVMFGEDSFVDDTCESVLAVACFTSEWAPSKPWPAYPFRPQTMLFRLNRNWEKTVTPAEGASCTYLREVSAHEAGHAYGAGHGTIPHSIMADVEIVTRDPLCGPTRYDVAVMMATYQSQPD